MMQASPYPTQPGMGGPHPGMPHGHPMQVQHSGHMGQPNPGMMTGMHPTMSGPQVTQGGPMVSGMPPNPGTPAPGGMHNAMAMAHLNGQGGPMFQNNHSQLNMGQMQQMNANMIARQRAMSNMMQAQGMQGGHNMMGLQNMHGLNPQQMQQMKAMNMPMQQQMQHMTPQQQQMLQQQQQYQHQQRMMAQHAQQQQQMMSQQRQQAAQQAQQQHANQQVQMNRQQEPTTTAPPQPQPTPAPQPQPQTSAPLQQPIPTPQHTPQKQPQPQPPTSQPQVQNAPASQIKQSEDEEVEAKNDIAKQQLMMDMAQQGQQDFSGQCILQLLSYYDTLAGPQRPLDIDYWQEVTAKYYSPYGSIRQQLYNNKTQGDKTFQLQYPILARFYHSHFKNGIKRILMQSFEHAQEVLPNGGYRVMSKKLFVTYEYYNGIRVTAHGSLEVTFDEMQKIENLFIAVKGWTEYIPRALTEVPQGSPELVRQSPKLTKKNLPKNMQNMQRPNPVPPSPVHLEWGVPQSLVQFLEIAEVMTTMGSLMEYYVSNQLTHPREALNRYNAENARMYQAQQARMQNMNAAAVNGQAPFATQRMGMNAPNQFQSPAFAHLNLPQNQQSPHMNHTPSPGHGQGGVQMVHQMSQQGSNLSGSQGPSTNTSPNVTNKRRRASAIKEEDAAQAAGIDKTKPSPRVGKRQKGAPA